MCLHFHPMAVSRWFSAASLKQVSNMAITGSGSLAVSLYVFVISAAFLPKGMFFLLAVLFVSDAELPPFTSESPRSAGEKLWCVCALDAHKLPPEISASLSIALTPLSTPKSPRCCFSTLFWALIWWFSVVWKGVVPSFTANGYGRLAIKK